MILGKICGKVSTISFQFKVSSQKAKKLQFVQVNHPEYGFVLAQILELERSEEDMLAKCQIIGYKDIDGHIKNIRTPFHPGDEVLEAEDSFIQSVVQLKNEGGFIGYLEGKKIPIYLNLQKILTKHLCVLAKTGAGKSYLVGVLIEEILEKKVPVIIIDPHGEYASLRLPNEEEKERLQDFNLHPKGYSGQIQEFGDPRVKEEVRPLKLDERMNSYELMKMLPIQLTNTQEAMLFSVIKDLQEVNFDNIIFGLQQLNSGGKWNLIDTIMYLRNLNLFSASYTDFRELIHPGKCSIINLKGLSPEIQDMIVYKLMKDLFAARKQERIPPFFCILEEAHNFIPERGFGKSKSGEVIRLISSEGRKFGLGLCVVSQRPALVQKTVLAQCNTQMIMKVTNPNDLRSIVSSIEGITSETENEIQNLPIGSALVCGIVDRPLMVNIRPRRSLHGGHAVDVLGQAEEEFEKDIIEESKKFEEEGLMLLIKPHLSLKDIKLMSDRPIQRLTTYLIPTVFFSCEKRGNNFNVLIDKVKGKIILDPEKSLQKELPLIDLDCNFPRKPVFDAVPFDVKIEESISTESLKKQVQAYCTVSDFKECFIVYYKVEY